MLANTEIVPTHLRGKPEHIYAIILTGHEIGISPTNALQSFASINGKLTMSAELMRALILGAGHSLSFTESSTTSCTIVGRRKGTGDTATVTYSKEDAERAGLWNSNTWKKYPRQLLSARATTELARLLFPDLIKGISYTPEELGGEWSENDDNSKPTFHVEHAAIEGEIIDDTSDIDEPGIAIEPDTSREDERQDPPEPAVDKRKIEYPDRQQPEGYEYVRDKQETLGAIAKNEWATDKQIQMITDLIARLQQDLQNTEYEARQTLYDGRTPDQLTKKEASTHIKYIKSLTEED